LPLDGFTEDMRIGILVEEFDDRGLELGFGEFHEV